MPTVGTALQLNWTNVSFTPTSGTATPITRVTACHFNEGGEVIEFAGDNNRYPVVIAQNVSRPSCSVTSGDVATLHSLAGSVGAFTATQDDALGVTGGGVVWAMANAVAYTADAAGNWGAFGSGTLQIKAYSSDGTTNPLTLTRI